MLYPITTIIAIDQATGARVENGSGYVYALSDTARATPLSIFDLSGLPLPSNLLTTNSAALIPPFQVDGEWQVVFVSGDSEIILTSYLGLKEEAAASADAANTVVTRANNGEFKGAQGDSAYQVWLSLGNTGTVEDYRADIEGPPGKDGSNVLPTDEAITQAINDTASSTRGALNATYVGFDGTDPLSIPVVKPAGDTRAGVWEFTHNATTGYMYHLLAGAGFGGDAAILAIGNDNGTGTSILLPNKAGGRAIVGDQRATVTAANGYWLHVTQRSPAAPLVRLEMQANDAAPLQQWLAFGTPGPNQLLAYFGDPNGEAGTVRAASGELVWQRNIVVKDNSGTKPSMLVVRDNDGVPATQRDQVHQTKDSTKYYSYSGTDSLWYPFSITTAGSYMTLKAGGAAGIGAEATTPLITIRANELSFFNAPATTRPTAVPVTAAGIHAALVQLGLIAA